MKGSIFLLGFAIACLSVCLPAERALSQPVVTITNGINNCNMGPTGSLTANATLGTAPYSYYWYNSSWGMLVPGTTFIPMTYGTYDVIVTDNASAKDTATITISQISWSVSAVPVLQDYGAHTDCEGENGEVAITITGGTGPYRVVVTASGVSVVPPIGTPVHDTIVSSTSITLGELEDQYYDVHVYTNSGSGCYKRQGITLDSRALPPLIRVSGELYSNGHYVSCDTCADGRFSFNAEGAYGDVTYGWLRTSPEFEPDILAGRSTLSIPWHWQDGFSPSGFEDFEILVMGSDEIDMDTLSSETWYFAMAMDEIGCISVKTLWIERPRPAAGAWQTKGNTADSLTVLGTVNEEPLRFVTDSTVRMTITPEGQVGIGIDSVPDDYLMAVNGRLIAEEVEVKLNGDWPDFVFEEGYYLPPLDSLQAFITRNGHLPGFESAAKMRERGSMASGQTVTALVQKVEELTLYVLQLQKQVEALQQHSTQMDVKVRGLDRATGAGNGNGDRPGNSGGQH